MELTIPKSELARALFVTQNVVARKSTMPILSNVLLTANDGTLKIAGTDLEMAAATTVKAKVKKGGSTTVSARMLSDLVRELPEADVTLTVTDGERLEIKAAKTTMRIIGASAQEYPSLPGMGVKTTSAIAARQLLEMISRTLYAVSTDETRFNLNGVCFQRIEDEDEKGKGKKGKGEGALRLVATDGHRLALVTRPTPDLGLTERVIVPKKGLTELKKLLEAAGDQDVGLSLTEGFLVLEQGDTKIAVRLIDGEFPDYSMVLPKSKGTQLFVNNLELQQALRRVLLVVSDKEKSVRLDVSEEELQITSSSPDLGDARESLSCRFEGKPITVGFNAGYLLDAISSMSESQEVCLELNGELGPGQLYSQGDESYLAIVMPMRLQSVTQEG